MKKTLLLSVVASTMIMAGGDIAPVEPAVATPAAASGFSVDKVTGYAKLWYETTDKTDFFDKNSGTSGDAVVSIKAEGKAGVMGYGFRITGADTLGLEDNLVDTRRANDGAGSAETIYWAEEAYLTYAMGDTTAKMGRQHLDTPFAFTEKWDAVANSFDAVVLVNNSIDNATLIGAYVGKANDRGDWTHFENENLKNGTFAFGAAVKPMDSVAVNAWYYDVQSVATAYWVDATVDAGVAKLTGIYAGMDNGADETTGYALSAATSVADFALMGAYSSVDDGTGLALANTGTGMKKTKLPTAGVYSDGVYVAQPGADTWKVKAATKVAGFSLAAQYVSCENDVAGKDSDEFDFIVGTKIADLDVKAIYVNREYGTAATATKAATEGNTMDHIRIITSYSF